jgi:hypothetical protein
MAMLIVMRKKAKDDDDDQFWTWYSAVSVEAVV